MKTPRPKAFPVMKMPMPASKGVKAGLAALSSFAHHPPATAEAIPRMSRPGHAKGPHN